MKVLLVFVFLQLSNLSQCQRNRQKKKKSEPKLLSQPNPEKCGSRPKQFNLNGHNYFFSKFESGFEDLKGNWLEGRNFCREYCMDLVSLETQEENDFFVNFLKSSESYKSGNKETVYKRLFFQTS